MDFFADLSAPDSLRFESDLHRREFRIRSCGNADLYKLDSSFVYTAYERDIPSELLQSALKIPISGAWTASLHTCGTAS